MKQFKRVVIHVGIHKTGSTSIQEFLYKNRIKLRELNIDYYEGKFIANNHVELHAAAMRVERDSPFKLNMDLKVDNVFRANVTSQVSQYINNSSCDCIVFSAEGLSYLRYEDEMNRLKEMIPESQIEIIIFIRDDVSFIKSYENEMKKHTMPTIIENDSFAYTANDSWLIDFESRINNFKKAFGDKNVVVLNYGNECVVNGNVIPSFLNFLGIKSHFNKQEWEDFFFNRSM